jgi:hypothetical protein
VCGSNESSLQAIFDHLPSLENFRSCLKDCSDVLSTSPFLPSPPTDKLSRKCLFRSGKALISLKRYNEAVDALEKLEELNRLVNEDDPVVRKTKETVRTKLEDEVKKEKALKEKKEQEEVSRAQIAMFLKVCVHR